MTIIIEVLVAAALISFGYVYCCYYLGKEKQFTSILIMLKLTKMKVFYLILSIISILSLLLIFEEMYDIGIFTKIKLLSLVSFLIPAAAIDLRKQVIPNQLLFFSLTFRVLLLVFEFIFSTSTIFLILTDSIVGAVIISAFFLLLYFVFKNSIGMGDIKLFAIMGLYQGLWGVINSVFFSLMTSFLISIGLLVTRKKSRKDTISFAPSILLGTIIAIGLTGM